MGFYRQLPSRMVFEGMSRQRAALLLSITGATSVIGRFVSGFVGNWACVSRTLLYALAVLMTGVVTCALVLGTSFVYTSVIAALAGVSLGTNTTSSCTRIKTYIVIVCCIGTTYRKCIRMRTPYCAFTRTTYSYEEHILYSYFILYCTKTSTASLHEHVFHMVVESLRHLQVRRR